MYCLDTNIIVNYLRGDKQTIFKINELNEDCELFVTPLTLCELYRGAYLSKDSEIKVRLIKEFIGSFVLLEFNEKVSLEYGKEYSRLKKLGKITENIDLMIACFAKTNNLILVTRNKKHFENIGIKIESW
ncbi:MAG: type II toxin-antitoxin system VapC family toxin [Candidatus Pacearchaeota archaeon]|jgi:tRNA(fMet)-specific endonuclease VapC